MNRDEQLKELFRKHWEKSKEERRAELVELGVIQEEKSEAYKEGYNKAIDDFVKLSKEKWIEHDDLGLSSDFFDYMDEIAQQLKAGVKNE